MVRKKEPGLKSKYSILYSYFKASCILLYAGLFSDSISMPDEPVNISYLSFGFACLIQVINTIFAVTLGTIYRFLPVSPLKLIKGLIVRIAYMLVINYISATLLYIFMGLSIQITTAVSIVASTSFPVYFLLYIMDIIPGKPLFVLQISIAVSKILDSVIPGHPYIPGNITTTCVIKKSTTENCVIKSCSSTKRSIVKFFLIIVQLYNFKKFSSSILCDF